MVDGDSVVIDDECIHLLMLGQDFGDLFEANIHTCDTQQATTIFHRI
uniref:Uncharacterized protein n=1 Tax=Parascaris equorum TaxID=6256 RepID=A0A914S6Q7_PAREQ